MGTGRNALQEGVNTVSNPLYTKLTDGDNPLGIDQATRILMAMDYEHHEIHEGDHYTLCGHASLGLNAIIDIIIRTPNIATWGHFIWEIDITQSTQIDIYEGASGISGGSTLIPLNNNRNSSNTSIMTIIQNPSSIVSTGTLLPLSKVIGANRSAGQDNRNKEIILKQNSIYLMRGTSLAAANTLNYCLSWYEHESY